MNPTDERREANIERLRLGREKIAAAKADGTFVERIRPKDRKHIVRSKTGDVVAIEYTERRAIKFMCNECLGWDGNPKNVCVDKRCPLYPFRGPTSPVWIEQEGQ